MDLFSEYGHPKPFPKDMFLRLQKGCPDSAYVILGQEGTGADLIGCLTIKFFIIILFVCKYNKADTFILQDHFSQVPRYI